MKKNAIIFFSVLILVCAIGLVTIFFFVLYPIKYSAYVKKYSEAFEVPQHLVYSVINAESRFNKNATSKVGAQGLMQLMPTTANEIAIKLGDDFSSVDLYNPETNIKYGCYYLKYLLKMFSGNVTNAVASYNAGYNKVISWLDNKEYAKNGVLTNIPIPETKNYVKKVNNNLKIYKTIAKS